jgi:nucleotidyltransferase AbiEii toxin of type IV toxin-antitoxin system
MMDLDKLLSVAEAFNREGVEYIVFGGAAVNLHGIFRATEDVDFFVRPEPENVARIKRALRSLWDDPSIDEIQDDDMIGDYPSFRYGPPDERFDIDVVSRLGEMFQYSDLECEVHEIDGVAIRLATPATLVRMKRDTVRFKDRDDAMKLRQKFDLPEE